MILNSDSFFLPKGYCSVGATSLPVQYDPDPEQQLWKKKQLLLA